MQDEQQPLVRMESSGFEAVEEIVGEPTAALFGKAGKPGTTPIPGSFLRFWEPI